MAGLKRRQNVNALRRENLEATYIEENSHAAADRKGLDEDVVKHVVDDEARISVVDRAESLTRAERPSE